LDQQPRVWDFGIDLGSRQMLGKRKPESSPESSELSFGVFGRDMKGIFAEGTPYSGRFATTTRTRIICSRWNV